MIVTGERLAPVVGVGVAGFGSGAAAVSPGDTLAGATAAFAERDAGGAGRVDSAIRFVAFTSVGFVALSASARVLTTGGVAAARGRGAGASLAGDGCGTSAALARCWRSRCDEGARSLVDGDRGTAIVAITTTAIPASIPNCLPVVCHGSVACITGAAVGGVDSTAAGEAGFLAGFALDVAPFRFFAGFFVRGRFSASTSVETSNVQRTRRPDRSGETLICCFFGTTPAGATHVPRDFSCKSARSLCRPLQNCRATFNSGRVPVDSFTG